MAGPTAASGKLKPSYHGRKTKHKDDINVRSPTLRLIQFIFKLILFYFYIYSVVQHVHHLHKVI